VKRKNRNIKGNATIDEAIELTEEGIDIFHIPDTSKEKLN